MLNKYYLIQLIKSKYIFYLVLFINLILLCVTKFYPSMDGPAHLYNSNILNHLIKGNNIISEFYTINTLPIPNWTSHFILAIFLLVLPAWLAEKVLLILYVSGMALSFRFLIRALNPENISLSILIFPFIYTLLFHLGFYNFSISFILFFTTLGFWLRNRSSDKICTYFILLLLITASYFSNVLIFGFLGFTIGLYILYFTFINNKNIALAFQFGSKKLFLLCLVSIPGLISLIIFYNSVTFPPSDQTYSTKELLKWINDARPFIVYNYVSEEIITEQYFHVLLILLSLSFILKNKVKRQHFNYRNADIIAIPLFISAILLFITPNGFSAGMMSDRYCLMFFILGLIWIISRTIPSNLYYIIIYFILTLHFGLLFKHLNGTIRKLDTNAIAINKAESYIDENSIVLPINLSDNWLETHFSNYLGIDKPMIILENYEASVGWFPIKWNSERVPNICLEDKNSVSGVQWINNSKSMKTRQIEYVLLYGNTSKINDTNWKELKELLLSDFKLSYKSENNYVMLYEKLR